MCWRARRLKLTASFIAVGCVAGLIGQPVALAGQTAPAGAWATSPRTAASSSMRPAERAAGPSVNASATFNPVTPSQGFTVFVQGNAALNATASGGTVALGGNLSFGSNSFNVASQTAGTFTAPGDAQPTGLLVGGAVNWAATSSSGALNILSNTYVKIGNLTGSSVAQSGTAATHIVPTGNTYNQSPRIAEVVNQPTASVSQSGLINFTSAFGTLSGQSADMASCAANLVLTNSNGTPLPLPLPSATSAFITLAPNMQNVLNISAANLANISLLQFRNLPTATMPLIINVDTSGVGNSFTWTPPNINGFQNSAAPYLLWNFSNASQLTIGGSQTVPGTIYAPGATFADNDGNGLNGGVIAAAFTQGASGGSPNGGQILPNPFAATITSCATSALTIALTATPSSAAPGQPVHYTVSATNSGSVAYTGATFTVSLSKVLTNASYNNDASATAGSVSYTSPNLTWTGNLAIGASATITFSATVNNPDTGNGVLTATVTSTTTGSNCASGSTDSRCTASVSVASLTIAASASSPTTTPGATVTYSVTVTNTGQTAYTGATFTDSLSGLLGNASYNSDGSATAGSVSYTSPNLTWTGNLAIGASATITFSATVNNPDTGSGVLATTVTSATTGSNCAIGSTDSRCATSVTVLMPGLTIALSADTGSTTPGSVVHYTIKATNSGQTAITGATVTDSLSGLLDDANYNNDASATAGSVSFSSPSLTWTGSLAVGASVTITYSVTAKNPDTGDKVLVTAVTSTTTGNNCPAGGTDSRCSNSVTVLVPGLTIAASAGGATTTPGSVVHYTIAVTNSGQTAYTGATFTDPLSGVLDDASYNGDASATGGSASFSSPNLTWTGNLAVGASVTVTFSVTVNSPDTGNDILASTVTSATTGSNCASGSTDANCTVTVNVAVLTIAETANVATATPGGVVRFTSTFTNAGQVPYTGITIVVNASDVFDDAIPNGDQTATSGTILITGNSVTWTGDIPVGGTVVITGSVTVKNPDTGNKVLFSAISTSTPGSNCPPGGTDPRCSVSVPVLVPGLTMSQAANVTSAVPGQRVTYTVTISDTGQTPYAGAVVTTSLAGTTGDAGYDNDASVTSGSLSYASPVLTWTGDLAPGGTAVITYSVTVNNPDAGGKALVTVAASTATGSNCPPASPNAGCQLTVLVLTPALTITKTASTATAVPGQVITYTITVTDSGQTPYTGATFTDSLAGVIDDAPYNGDVSATSGIVSFTSPNLTWTGDLAVGATATITYSVTVDNPDTGDTSLTNTVVSSTPGSNCPAAGGDPRCTVTITLVNAATLTFTVASDVSSVTAGGTVHYTITVANSGLSSRLARFTEPLTGVLDDASYNGDASATAGTVAFASPNLTWTGRVPATGSVTITYSVTVTSPDTGGDLILASTLSSTSTGSNCPAASTDPRCSSTVTVSALLIVDSANVSTTTPGGVVVFTATFTNTGQTPYTGITIATSGSNVFDDATSNGNQTASSGTLSVSSSGVTWTGNIPVSGVVTIIGSITVKNPDPGNKVIAPFFTTATPGSNCPPGGTDPRCGVSVLVLIPALTISQAASATTALPGQQVTFTVTIADAGGTSYTGAVVTDVIGGSFDDASYDNNASFTSGSTSYTSGTLTWTGDLSPGESAVITYSLTVNNPDNGDKLLISTLSSAATGSSCPATGSGCQLTIAVLTPALTTAITATPAPAVPGGTVSYTITIINTGQTSYTGATVTANLTGVLDDAAYNNNASATAGTVGYSGPDVTWTGDLIPAASATVTFSVTVNSPDTNDHVLISTIASNSAGGNCPTGGTDPRCTVTTDIAELTISNTASTSSTTPGSVVGYSVTITNAGTTSYTGTTVSDDLTGILDDASFDNDAATTTGSVTYLSPGLSWTGSLAPGAAAVITFTVTVSNPDTGDLTLSSTVSTPAAGSNCPAGSTDPACTSVEAVLIPDLTITKTASTSTTTPGSTVGYTITVDDTGPTAYTAATVTDSLNGLLNDATYNGNAAATVGTVSYASPVLTWTGALSPGGSTVITYTITVNNPDTGDKHLVNTVTSDAAGSNCAAGSTDAACTATVTDLVPALTITKTASAATANPGTAVHYTITVADTGQTSYTPATVTDSLAGVLGDAAYNNDASATTGTVSYSSPVLTWTGSLDPGGTTSITYSVTVSNPDAGGRVLANTAASTKPGSTCPPGTTNPACTAVTSIIAGELSMTAPTVANLGTTAPGGHLETSLGTVQVIDNRGFGAGWTATVSATTFTTGTQTAAETIPPDDVSYLIAGLARTSGPATFSFTPSVTLSSGPQGIVTATNVTGNTTASWDPLIDISVPADAIAGPYTATITHSVS